MPTCSIIIRTRSQTQSGSACCVVPLRYFGLVGSRGDGLLTGHDTLGQDRTGQRHHTIIQESHGLTRSFDSPLALLMAFPHAFSSSTLHRSEPKQLPYRQRHTTHSSKRLPSLPSPSPLTASLQTTYVRIDTCMASWQINTLYLHLHLHLHLGQMIQH